MDNNTKDKTAEELEGYLRKRGINPSKPFNCLNPDHPDRHPSMSFDKKRHRAHCFSCGADYDIFDVIGIEYGLDAFPEKAAKAEQLFGYGGVNTDIKNEMPARDYSEYIRRCHARIGETDYPAQRGISPATAARFLLGFDSKFPTADGTWQAVIIPNGTGGFIARNTDLSADEKSRIRKRGSGGLFNSGALEGANEPVFIVEGEFDALSVCEGGGEAVALGSVANWRQLAELAAAVRPDYPLILALDNDEAGQRCASQLAQELTKANIPFYTAELPEGYKDPSAALQSAPEEFSRFIAHYKGIEAELFEAQIKIYMQNRTANYLNAFLDGITDSVNTPHIETKFNNFDSKLDGGLFEGLYIIGAITSLGKTTLALQMADQIAAGGRDVLIFSLEMARNELMAKSISRLTLLEVLKTKSSTALAKSARDITAGSRYASYGATERELIARAVEEYRKSAEHLYIHEGIGDIGTRQIRETVERHTRIMGEAPIVIVDYLQILAPHSERMTDKQNTDRAVLELKRISRDYKIPVIGISSFNRQNYSQSVTMEAFKESGAIEYSSDVLIGLQLRGAGEAGFNATAEKLKNPRDVELIVLKNRNGAAGVSVEFEYYPRYNYFREI